MYRILAFAALEKNIDLADQNKLVELALTLDVSFKSNENSVDTILDGKNIGTRLRNETIAKAASQIAPLQCVRDALLARQQAFNQPPGLIADGRDMGTVVFPDARVKIFLDASAQERAQRRLNQLHENGSDGIIAQILSEIQDRDHRDRNRAVAPLRPASDALVIDSTTLTIDQVVEQVLEFATPKLTSE